MDLKQLEFLVALDETRHFSQTAARCHVSQPTLSMRLRSLDRYATLNTTDPAEPHDAHAALLAEECALAISYNGLNHAVMMVTPQDLEEFVVGFSLAGGLIERLDDLRDLRLLGDGSARRADVQVSPRAFWTLKQQRRQLAGTSGCGLNFISRPIPDKWETTLQERVTFAPGGRQLYDSYLGTGGRLTDNFGLQLDVNTISGEYGREHSETDVQNYRLRGQWDIDDSRSLSFGVQRYIADMDLAGALSVADYKDDPRQSTRKLDRFEGDSDRVWGTYTQYLGAMGPFDDVEFSWTNFAQHSYRNFVVGLPFAPDATPTTLQDAPRDFRVWGSEPRLSLGIDGDGVSQTWLLGARLVKENVDFDVDRLNLNTGATSVVRDWVFDTKGQAAYVSNEIKLLDDRLTLTPGVRYEHAKMEYADGVSGIERKTVAEEWLPGLSIGYQASDDWFVYANAQRSLRVPQVFQIVRDGVVQAEISRNYETGVRFTPQDNLRIDFGLYRIDFDDQIVFANSRFQNLGSTRHQGIETEVFWTPAALPTLDLHAGYAYLDAELRTGDFKGNEVPYSSKHQFTVDGRYRFAEFWTYSLDGLYVSSAYTDDANSAEENASASVGELPAYWIWNTAIEREFKLQDDSVLTASAGISNLFDRQYYFRGIDTSPEGRQPAPGRTLTLGVNYRF